MPEGEGEGEGRLPEDLYSQRRRLAPPPHPARAPGSQVEGAQPSAGSCLLTQAHPAVVLLGSGAAELWL